MIVCDKWGDSGSASEALYWKKNNFDFGQKIFFGEAPSPHKL